MSLCVSVMSNRPRLTYRAAVTSAGNGGEVVHWSVSLCMLMFVSDTANRLPA